MAKEPTVVALVDADYLEYAAGFAGQHTHHLLTAGNDAIIGAFDSAEGRNEAETAWEGKGGDPNALLRWERVEVEPIGHVLHSAKKMLLHIQERVGEKFTTSDVAMQLYLTGSGNFRDQLATIRPYKGNRKPWHKPRLQREIRDYMVREWGAKVIYGQEADDEVCIRQSIADKAEIITVICGIDKDLLQCPGWHYDANKDAFANITGHQGLLKFYKQLLSGDPTDNVGGCYKIGTGRADTIVKEVVAAPRKRTDDLEALLYARVLQAYSDSIQKYGEDTDYAHLGAEKAVLENAQLLWLRREYGQVWTPPT